MIPAPQEDRGEARRLPRARRVTRGPEIRELMRRGKRSRTVHLDVFDSASPASYSRVGLVVPKHRQRIVDRNLLKRRLREVLRLEVLPRLDQAELNVDVLVRARSEAYQANLGALKDELAEWTDRRCSRGR